MKKVTIILTIAIAVMMGSCTISYEDCEIENRERETSLELTNNVIDSCVILAQEEYGNIIVLKENDGVLLATYELIPHSPNHVYVHAGWLIFLIAVALISLAAIVNALFDL